jgi:hypothetical protein
VEMHLIHWGEEVESSISKQFGNSVLEWHWLVVVRIWFSLHRAHLGDVEFSICWQLAIEGDEISRGFFAKLVSRQKYLSEKVLVCNIEFSLETNKKPF